MNQCPDHRLLRQYTFALVDASQREQIPAGISSRSLASGALSDSAELLPSLLVLGELNAQQHAALVELLDAQCRAKEPPVTCALLNATCTAKRIQLHLASAQVINGPGTEKAWLRLHDPRVWLQLPRVYQAADLRQVFGPVVTWTICLSGRWIETRPPEINDPKQSIVLRRSGPPQWAKLQRIGIVNRALARLGLSDHDDVLKHSPALDDLALRGQTRHQLQRTADLVEYVCLGWQISPRFDEHPMALRAIEEYRRTLAEEGDGAEPGASPIDALVAIPREHWPRMRDDLQTEHLGSAHGNK